MKSLKSLVALFLVILALVATDALATARTILPPIEQSDGSGWVVTAPRADQTGDIALGRPFAPERRGLLSALSGVVLVALLVVSTAFAAYTIRIAYRGERSAR